jgi:hypothetical protein
MAGVDVSRVRPYIGVTPTRGLLDFDFMGLNAEVSVSCVPGQEGKATDT